MEVFFQYERQNGKKAYRRKKKFTIFCVNTKKLLKLRANQIRVG